MRDLPDARGRGELENSHGDFLLGVLRDFRDVTRAWCFEARVASMDQAAFACTGSA